MAKDIIFDSERYEKRETVKRYLIPAAVLVGLIVVAVVAALLLRGSRSKPVTGGEDTPYPYTWAAGKNGSVILAVDRTAAPGYLWLPAAETRQLDISVTQDAQQGKTQFILTPQEAGRCVLEFRLQREDDPEDCIYQLSALSNTDFDGKNMTTSLLGISSRPISCVKMTKGMWSSLSRIRSRNSRMKTLRRRGRTKRKTPGNALPKTRPSRNSWGRSGARSA